MKKKNIDWTSLPFDYKKTDYRFLATYKNKSWDEGKLIQDNEIHLHEGSGSLHYAQQCFEGLKAYSTEDERILLFRPLENAKRMQKTAKRLLMPQNIAERSANTRTFVQMYFIILYKLAFIPTFVFISS